MFGFNPYSPYGMLPETMPQQGVLGQYPQNIRQPAQGQHTIALSDMTRMWRHV